MNEALAPHRPADSVEVGRDRPPSEVPLAATNPLAELIDLFVDLGQDGGGLEVIYRALSLAEVRFKLDDVILTTRNQAMGRQVFRLNRKAISANDLEPISTPNRLRSIPDVIPAEYQQLVLALAELALSTEAAKRNPLHDPLTGLPSRGVFNEALRAAAAQGSRYGWTFTVLVLRVRDGEDPTVLEIQRLGQAFARALRSGDTGARLSATTYVALLPNATSESPHALVGRFLGESGLHAKAIDYGSATTPNESVDPAELFRLAASRLGDV